MTLAEKIQKDLVDAMRAKDELRLSVIRGIKSAITYKETEKIRKLDETESIQLLQTLVKQRLAPAAGLHPMEDGQGEAKGADPAPAWVHRASPTRYHEIGPDAR